MNYPIGSDNKIFSRNELFHGRKEKIILDLLTQSALFVLTAKEEGRWGEREGVTALPSLPIRHCDV